MVRAVGRIKFTEGLDFGVGIDVQHARTHSLRLFLSDGSTRSENLAVQIGKGNRVVVDEQEMADACAYQSFCSVRTDAAETENRDARFGKFGEAVCSK